MKRSITVFFVLILLTFVKAQSWQPTNLANVNYLNITGLESHQGELYSILFNGFSADFHKLQSSGTSWTQISLNGVSGIPSYMKSTGTRLYISTKEANFSSMIYYAFDPNGSFVADTAGLPENSMGKLTVFGLQYYDGKIVANLGSNGYWFKDTSATHWQQMGVANSFNGGSDPICFYGDSVFGYDNSGAFDFYVSGDFGLNWMPRATNLPAPFTAYFMTSNSANGRLYVAGAKSDGSQHGLYYSDDNGYYWTLSSAVTAFIGTDINGGPQEVKTMYANGDTLYISLENEATQTPPNVLSSASGITNILMDTTGLINDVSGLIYGSFFVKHNNDMAMGLNVRDVYLKGEPSIGLNNSISPLWQIYPNPSRDIVYFEGLTRGEAYTLKVYDVSGRLLDKEITQNHNWNIEDYPNGIYLFEIEGGGVRKQFRIIKK